jgi:radical SAM protein with 4Fe4S-binding SPASM domain
MSVGGGSSLPALAGELAGTRAGALSIDTLQHVLDRADARTIPINVSLELTHACNVDCEMCYLDLVPDSKIDALHTDEWKRILGELKAAGTLFVTLTGGEPLLRKDFFEIAQHARELSLAITIFTNGTLIDERNADRIAALHPLGVEISLLGGIAATHDAIAQRRGAFEKTIAGARRLRARGIPVLFKCVLMEKNVRERALIRAIADELGCRSYFDVEVSPKDNGSAAPQALAARDEDLVQALREMRAESDETFGPAEETPRAERLAMTPCAAGRRTCQIGPTGDVFPCTQWSEPVGNLRKTSFASLWNGDATLHKIRATHIGDLPVCAECDLLTVCGPCMALSLMETGSIGPSPTKCAAAEVRARAEGIAGRSAWFVKLEAEAAAQDSARGRPLRARVRLPLVG